MWFRSQVIIDSRGSKIASSKFQAKKENYLLVQTVKSIKPGTRAWDTTQEPVLWAPGRVGAGTFAPLATFALPKSCLPHKKLAGQAQHTQHWISQKRKQKLKFPSTSERL